MHKAELSSIAHDRCIGRSASVIRLALAARYEPLVRLAVGEVEMLVDGGWAVGAAGMAGVVA